MSGISFLVDLVDLPCGGVINQVLTLSHTSTRNFAYINGFHKAQVHVRFLQAGLRQNNTKLVV